MTTSRNLSNRGKDFVSVKDFGATGDGSTDDTAAIQAALDAATGVFLPAGNYKISASLNFNDYNYLMGVGRGSTITATHSGSVIKGKNVTTAATTNVRRYHGGGRDFQIFGPGKAVASTIALDMRGCTMFKWYNVFITTIQTAVRQGNGYSSYYNEYYGVDISSVTTGYSNSTLGNENLVVGGRVNDSTTGTTDSDNSHNKYIGLAIEVFTTGHVLTSPATQNIQFLFSRLENTPTTGTAFSLDSTSQDTLIDSPAIIGVSTTGFPSSGSSPTGTRTTIRASEMFADSGGSARKSIKRSVVNQAIAALAAGAVRQDGFTISGVAAGDAVSVTLPATWPNGLVAGSPIISSGIVYLQLSNPTAGSISVAAADFVFSIIKYV